MAAKYDSSFAHALLRLCHSVLESVVVMWRDQIHGYHSAIWNGLYL